MSYCRWSSDDFQCDIYCYADVSGGYTTHVAGNRPLPTVALPPSVPFDKNNIEAWYERHQAVMAWVEKAERKPIGLPHDGETFNDPTAEDAANRLQTLKNIGYNVPQYAIDELLDEAKQDKRSND